MIANLVWFVSKKFEKELLVEKINKVVRRDRQEPLKLVCTKASLHLALQVNDLRIFMETFLDMRPWMKVSQGEDFVIVEEPGVRTLELEVGDWAVFRGERETEYLGDEAYKLLYRGIGNATPTERKYVTSLVKEEKV